MNRSFHLYHKQVYIPLCICIILYKLLHVLIFNCHISSYKYFHMSYYYVHKLVYILWYKHSFYKVLCVTIPNTHILININYYKFVHFWRKLAELLEYKYNPFCIHPHNLVLINHNLVDTYFHMFCHF